MSQLHTWATMLGGEVCGEQVLCPGPGHSADDRSLSVKIGADGEPVVHSFAGDDWRKCLDHVRQRLGMEPFKPDAGRKHVATYEFRDPTTGEVRYRKERVERADGTKEFYFKPAGRNGCEPLLYGGERLADLAEGQHVFVVEGEKKVNRLRELGAIAVSGDSGASSKWLPAHADLLRGLNVVLWPDSDEPGEKYAARAAYCLRNSAASLRVVRPFGPPNGAKGRDVCDWTGSADDLAALAAGAEPYEAREAAADGVSIDDFNAYMPTHSYIFTPSREMWPAASVNVKIPPIAENGKPISASAWLDKNKSVEQMTWAPGEPMLIPNRLISDGGWIERMSVTCFNLYRPPVIKPGNADAAGPWLEHVKTVFPVDDKHIINCLAHRVQRPQEKINHALVLGGNQGIGKDTLLEPVKHAIGPWNFAEVAPTQIMGRFNGYLKSVILRVSEARDLGDVDRFRFYDHMKAYTAAPPDVLRVDEKNLREHAVLNCCGVIITTNHKTDGIYLPPDDRRHFVAWSDLTKEEFAPAYWNGLWNWYTNGGNSHVAAYLAKLDLSGFDPKAPPPKTAAFWDIVDANRAPEDAELADLLDEMGNPDATTLSRITAAATGEIMGWLADRKNRRVIPHRLEKCGYVPVRNGDAKDGLWKIRGARQVIYGKSAISISDRSRAARKLTE